MHTVLVGDETVPVSQTVLDILNGGKEEILAALMAKEKVVKEAITETAPPEVFTQLELPSVIQELYPDLLPHEIEQVRSWLGDWIVFF